MVASAALVSALHLLEHNIEIVKRWINVIQEAAQNKNSMVQVRLCMRPAPVLRFVLFIGTFIIVWLFALQCIHDYMLSSCASSAHKEAEHFHTCYVPFSSMYSRVRCLLSFVGIESTDNLGV